MPRVSVIIPALDAEPYIEETLASVVAQSFPDWEVVLADDGSTDRTADLAAAADGRVRVVRTTGRLGPAGARNTALQHATGELVAFLDADDLWLPGYLATQVGLFDRESEVGPSVGIVACDARVRTPAGDEQRSFLRRFPGYGEPLTLASVLRQNRIYVSALVPRAAGEEIGWFDAGLFGTEDHDLWIRILETGRRAVLNTAVLAIYRDVPGSVSSNVARQAVNDQGTYRRALARGRLNAEERRVAEQELRYHEVREAVAEAWAGRHLLALARQVPAGAMLAVRNPDRVRGWVQVLGRSG